MVLEAWGTHRHDVCGVVGCVDMLFGFNSWFHVTVQPRYFCVEFICSPRCFSMDTPVSSHILKTCSLLPPPRRVRVSVCPPPVLLFVYKHDYEKQRLDRLPCNLVDGCGTGHGLWCGNHFPRE